MTAATGVGWTCSNGPTVTCTRADALAAGATYPPIDITATVDPGAPANLASTASVDGGRDGDPTNNTDTDVAGVVAQANLALSDRLADRIAIGDTATYVRQYRDCRGTAFTIVKRGIKVGADGRFRATVPAPRGLAVVYDRALTRVRKTARNRTTYPTFTLVRGVAVAR